jgi:hypothetical protein
MMTQANGRVECGYVAAEKEWKLQWFSENFTTDPMIIYQKMNLILKFKTRQTLRWILEGGGVYICRPFKN